MATRRTGLKAVFTADNKGFMQSVKATRQAVRGLIKGTAMIGGAAVVAGGLALRRFMAVEKQMAEVNTIAQQTPEALAKMTGKVLELSAAFGQTKESLTKGLYDALSAGVPADNAIDFLTDASKLAIGGATDTATAVDLLTSVLNAYGMEADKAKDISDQLFATVRFGKTTIPELAQAMGQVAPIAAQVGVETEQLLGAFASLTKQGIKTEIASTALRGALTQLLSPSSALEKQLQKTFGTTNAQAILQTKTLQEVLDELGVAVDNDASKMAALFPNVRALNGVMALTGKSAGVARQGLDATTRAAGQSDKAFDTMADTVGMKWDQALQSLDNTLISTGDTLQASLLPMLEDFIKLLNDPETQAAIASFAKGMVGAFVKIAKFMREAINMYVLMREEMGKFDEKDMQDIQKKGRELHEKTVPQLESEKRKQRAKMVGNSFIPIVGLPKAEEARETIKVIDELIKQRVALEKIERKLPAAQGAP